MADALFGQTQQGVLALLFGKPERRYFTTEPIQLVGAGSGTFQRKLKCLIDSGLIRIDDFHRTTVPDIYAAGDCCTPFRTISTAIASGTKAGIFIHQDLHKQYLKELIQDNR